MEFFSSATVSCCFATALGWLFFLTAGMMKKKESEEWIFMAEGSAYTNFLYYLTEFPMLGVTVLAVAGIVLGIWLLRQNSSRTHVRLGA